MGTPRTEHGPSLVGEPGTGPPTTAELRGAGAAFPASLLLDAISHELRGPLTTVSLALALLREQADLDEGQRSMLLERGVTNTERMKAFADAITRYGSALRLVESSTTGRFDVGSLVAAAVAEQDTGDRLVTVTVEEAPVQGNEHAVRSAVKALLDNARVHTPPGCSITVTVLPYPDGALVRVEDDGPGVAERLRQRVFLPFDRGDAPAERPGEGLGLAIVAAVARFHAGAATVDEALGGGASFRMRLRSVSG